MRLFDRMLFVDWSAAAVPTMGKDSIWIADTAPVEGEGVQNIPTRAEATRYIRDAIEWTRGARRLFIGLDFAFGYPSDAAGLPGQGRWEAVWAWLADHLLDADDNANDRFEIAARLNASWDEPGPFWAHPPRQHHEGLAPTKPDYAVLGVRERRHVDALVPSAQPVWKLAYPGSVGSQALTGIARLQALRDERVAIWPFETGFADDLSKPVTAAELYPSLWPIAEREGEVKDAAQVRTLAAGFAAHDDAGAFRPFLDGPRKQPDGVREDALTHEAWMVGMADAPLPLFP